MKMMKIQWNKFLKFLTIYMAPFVISLYCFYINLPSNNTSNTDKYSVKHSSVWCRDSGMNSKLCKFKNVCYDLDLKSLLFFLGNLSVIKGLSNYKEFQTIQLSSVSLHNKYEANISVVDVNHRIFSFNYIEKALLFSRFKPDNVMHVIHDDLIPVYLTLEDICLGNLICQQNYRLILHDPYKKGLFYNLYSIFSSFEPVLLNNLSKSLCFGELHMGLIKDSIFYEYGFNKPQGPVQNIKLHSNDLLRFSSYVRQKLLNIKTEFSNNTIVLVSRKKTRRILNENDVIHVLENAFGNYYSSNFKVICLDLFENDTYTFVKEVSKASAFVGMHGAEMIFSIFLKTNATVVELFPYAIKPHVSFVKPLANIKGIYFNYIYWENMNKENSIFHPLADSLHGGISHLPTETQEEIQNETDNKSTNVESEWFYPSTVTHVECSYDSTSNIINVTWSSPFNIRDDQVFYDIFVLSKDIKTNTITEENGLVINVTQNEPDLKIQTWITAVAKTSKSKSKDVLIECTIS